jgi:hypothetical protein
VKACHDGRWRGVDEDDDGRVAGDGDGEVDGTNKVSRVVDSEPTVMVNAALLITVSNMTTET